MSNPPRTKPSAHPHHEEYCPKAIHNPLTGYEPKLLNNFDYSETSAMIFQGESGNTDTEPSYSCNAELDDEIRTESDRRSIQELTGIIDSQRREIDHTNAVDEQSRRDQSLLQEQLSEQNRDLREVHIKSLHEMEELKRVQGLQVDEFSRRR